MTNKEKIRAKVEKLIQERRNALKYTCFVDRERADMTTECGILGKVLLFIDSLNEELVVDGEVYQTIGDHVAWDYRVRSSRFTNKSLKLGDKVKLIIIKGE